MKSVSKRYPKSYKWRNGQTVHRGWLRRTKLKVKTKIVTRTRKVTDAASVAAFLRRAAIRKRRAGDTDEVEILRSAAILILHEARTK